MQQFRVYKLFAEAVLLSYYFFVCSFYMNWLYNKDFIAVVYHQLCFADWVMHVIRLSKTFSPHIFYNIILKEKCKKALFMGFC